jgi:hypothetical protein
MAMQIAEPMKALIEAAVVRLPAKGGLGVLVPGGFVLTAAHCIDWNGEGGMALGDVHLTEIETRSGERFRLSVCAVEPVSDLAVLESADTQLFEKDAEAFEAFCEGTPPVNVSTNEVGEGETLPVHVRTHEDTWLDGLATRYGQLGPTMFIKTKRRIKSGTSGGPVVDRIGALVGIVSWSNEGAGQGGFPRPHLVLPAWVLRRIAGAKKAPKVPACPKCGSAAIPIVWGNPGPELAEAEARGELVLGGCIIAHDDDCRAVSPAWHCTKCEHEFGRVEGFDATPMTSTKARK